MRVLIIADDLTGALDSAATLSATGLACVVARRPDDVAAALAHRPDVLAISTASREGSAAAAAAAVAAAVDAAGLPEIVFKKVDSRLKGHVGVEVAVLAQRAGLRRAIVAPAVPAQGRTVAGGCVVGTGVAAPIDVAAAVAASGLTLEVPDTASDAELDAALEHALGGPRALLVGAAGLSAALARRLAPRGGAAAVRRLQAPILFAIGSHDPITLSQVEALAGRADVTADAAPDGVCPPAAAGGGAQLVRLVPEKGRAFDARAAAARFAGGIAQLARSGRFGTLLACGGETADAILGALGQGALEVEGEVLPGVPVSSMLIGGQRLQFVTKSGGFGGPDALARVVEAAASSLEGAQ